MNDEIKEILAYFEEYIKIIDMHDSEPMLNWKDLKIVLDYITNLQQENERLNNIINEIQTMCKNEYYKKNTTDIDSIGISNNIWVMIYLKIKELKENK